MCSILGSSWIVESPRRSGTQGLSVLCHQGCGYWAIGCFGSLFHPLYGSIYLSDRSDNPNTGSTGQSALASTLQVSGRRKRPFGFGFMPFPSVKHVQHKVSSRLYASAGPKLGSCSLMERRQDGRRERAWQMPKSICPMSGRAPFIVF